MTSVWAWVRERRTQLDHGDAPAQRLAELMRALPSAAADEAHERVDSMVPEAVELARDLDEPWVELFIRHWHLQSRVLHRRQAGDELREAVSLLDYASGPRTRGCPQSVCAVQDLAVCYSIRDGPGYVEERLAVARETLERIDPSWSCFDCISAEYVSALFDDQRPAEALEFIEAQIAKLAEHGDFEPGFNMISNRAQALAELGRAEQALELLDSSVRDVASQGRSRQMSFRQTRASILITLGRVDEALALHPPLSAIRATASHFRDWVANLAALIHRERIPNTMEVGRELLEVQRQLERNGARWDTAVTALTGAELALARAAPSVAALLIEDYDRVALGLRKPERLASRRGAIADALARARAATPATAVTTSPPAPAPSPPAPAPAPAPSAPAPEAELERLRAARRARPGAHTLEYAAALRQIGRADMARATLEAEADPSTPEVLLELAQVLLEERDHAALDRLFERALANAPGAGVGLPLCWIYGESLRSRGELARAVEFDAELLSRAPELTPLRLRVAANARAQTDWETALAALDIAVTQLEPGEADWDRITAATVLGRWSKVRAAAARLGIDTGPSGPEHDAAPIELELGTIRCEFVEPSGQRQRYWARRSSPCAATIIEIAMPGDPQHYGDQIVFEPVDLDRHQRQQDAEQHRPCFEVVNVLESGHWRSFLLRGHDPGRARFEALRATIRRAGFGFERITAPGRRAADPRDPKAEELETVFVLLAIPEHVNPSSLRELVQDATAEWELPLLDPALDLAADQPEAAASAKTMLERWKP